MSTRCRKEIAYNGETLNRFLRLVRDDPFLEIFKDSLVMVLSSLIRLIRLTAEGLD